MTLRRRGSLRSPRTCARRCSVPVGSINPTCISSTRHRACSILQYEPYQGTARRVVLPRCAGHRTGCLTPGYPYRRQARCAACRLAERRVPGMYVEGVVRLIETTDDPGRHDLPQRAVVEE